MGNRASWLRRFLGVQLIVLVCGYGGCQRRYDVMATQSSALTTDNGWDINGWNTNGWNTNGWSTSGWMTTSTGELTGTDFLAGLGAGDVAYNTFTMGYLIACALADGDCVNATIGGNNYQWCGRLGLAPEWKSAALTATGQRWISACMAAHYNRIGHHVVISIIGGPLSTEGMDPVVFSWQEAAFFGNLFDGTGLSVCGGSDNPVQAARNLARIGRDCGDGDCPQMTFLHQCSGVCSGTGSDGRWLHCAGYDEVLTTYLTRDDARVSEGLPGQGY
jgi:hypothetical protein